MAENKQKFILRCGTHNLIQDEQRRYDLAIEQNRVERGTAIALSERTPRYAAVAFRFVDFGRSLHTITFGDYVRTADVGHVPAVMRKVFEQLSLWHGVTYTRETNIDALFSIEPETIQDRLREIVRMVGEEARSVGVCDIELDDDTLSFVPTYGDGFTVGNLVGAVESFTQADAAKTVRHGVIHGHLKGDTIILNRKDDAWFIDFSRTEVDAPLLLDLSRFEASLRVDWAGYVDLSACHLLEMALRMNDSTLLTGTPYDAYLNKQFVLVQAVRSYAGEVGDAADHLHFLFLTLLEQFLMFEPEAHYTIGQIEVFVCLLVAAAHVGMQSETAMERGAAVLTIDQARNEVYVGGQPVQLAPSEYDLLLYLHQHANQTRSRRDIAQDVFEVNIEDEFDEHQIEYNRINTAINRLRQKIEINPKQPRFLKTIRGKGYRLDIDE